MPLRAAEPDPFVATVSAAYPQYRMSWFYCRTGNDFLAGDELASFTTAWRAIIMRFRNAPPPAFAGDRDWSGSLDRITGSLDRAAALIKANDTKAAVAPLAEIRREMGALRRRNGVVIFSDHVDAYGAVVERLTDLRRGTRGAEDLTTQQLDAYAGLARELRAAVETLRARAPAALVKDPGFAGAIQGNLESISKLERGIRNRHARAIHGSVSSVRADFVLLFTRYG